MIKVKLTALAKELMLNNQELNFVPTRATNGSAGYDLRACIKEPVTLKPKEVYKFPTGVHIWLDNLGEEKDPDDRIAVAGLYLPRSSNPGTKLTNTVGLLDDDYQGESFFKYENTSDQDITIQVGEKIGQLVVIPVLVDDVEIFEEFDEVTTRGEGGFGSSGKV